MNCNECISRKVCFVQHQIDNLADRVANKPFNNGFCDTDADRTEVSIRQHERLMIKQAEITYKLREVIGSNCKLYLQDQRVVQHVS